MSQSQTIPGLGHFTRWFLKQFQRYRKTLCSGPGVLWEFSAPSPFFCKKTMTDEIQIAWRCESRNSSHQHSSWVQGKGIKWYRQVQAEKSQKMLPFLSSDSGNTIATMGARVTQPSWSPSHHWDSWVEQILCLLNKSTISSFIKGMQSG